MASETATRVVGSQLPPTKEIVSKVFGKLVEKSPFFRLGNLPPQKQQKAPWKTRIHFPNFPLIYRESEKVAKSAGGSRKIVFQTVPKLTKPEISQFVNKVYGYEVKKINTMNVEERRQPKMKAGRGRHWTSIHTEKKAIITIKPPAANTDELLAIEKIRAVIPEVEPTIPTLPPWLKKQEGEMDYIRQQQHLRLVRKMKTLHLLGPFLKDHTPPSPSKEEGEGEESKALVTGTTKKGRSLEPKAILERVIRETIVLPKPKRKWWTIRRSKN
jgi:ribosomal protein L23